MTTINRSLSAVGFRPSGDDIIARSIAFKFCWHKHQYNYQYENLNHHEQKRFSEKKHLKHFVC